MKYAILKAILFSFLFINTSTACADEIHDLTQKQDQDHLILSVPVKLGEFDPTKNINAHTTYLLPLIFEPLIMISSKKELQPQLAKSWTVSPDKKKIIITINPNHYFTDGHEVTAIDVVNSFFWLCRPNSQTYTKLPGLNGCFKHANRYNTDPKVSAIGKYKVQFDISSSPTNFLYQLSYLSAVITKKSGGHLIGSGPYLVREQRENYTTLDKNVHYQGNNPSINAGIIFVYANQDIVAHYLSEGITDGAIIYRMADILTFKDSRYKLITSNPNISEILVLNNNKFPFNKGIVRRALTASLYNNFDHSCIHGARHAYGIIPSGIGGAISGNSPRSLHEYTPQEVFKQVEVAPTSRTPH